MGENGHGCADGARYAAVASVVASVLALAGCASAPTVGDGSLGVSWAVLPTPVCRRRRSEPAPAETSAESVPRVSWDMSVFSAVPQKTVDCSVEHLAETFFVGTFPADAETDAAGRPKLGTALFRSAYETCAERANEFLGADFHTGRLSMRAGHAVRPAVGGQGPLVPVRAARGRRRQWQRSIPGPRRCATACGATDPLALTCGDEKLSADQQVSREHHVHVLHESARHRTDRHLRRAGRRIPRRCRGSASGAGRLLWPWRRLSGPDPDDAGQYRRHPMAVLGRHPRLVGGRRSGPPLLPGGVSTAQADGLDQRTEAGHVPALSTAPVTGPRSRVEAEMVVWLDAPAFPAPTLARS